MSTLATSTTPWPRRIPRPATFLAVLLLNQACSLPVGSARHDLPSWCPRTECVGVPAVVPRSGVIDGTGDCLWIELDGMRSAVLWPPGYSASFDQIVLFDAGGQAFAGRGDTISAVMLGPDPLATPDACGLTTSIEFYGSPIAPDP